MVLIEFYLVMPLFIQSRMQGHVFPQVRNIQYSWVLLALEQTAEWGKTETSRAKISGTVTQK